MLGLDLYLPFSARISNRRLSETPQGDILESDEIEVEYNPLILQGRCSKFGRSFISILEIM